MTESIDQITSLVTEVEEGNVDALKAYIDLMRLNKVLEASLAQIKESAIKEAKNHSKSFEFYGAKVEVKEGSARYDYKGVSQWVALSEKMKGVESAAKQRALNPNIIMADADTGEEIFPAMVSYNKETIAITLPKI
jgi:hypothetical protein